MQIKLLDRKARPVISAAVVATVIAGTGVCIHTPEFEKNPDNVRAAVEKFGIEFPVLQDNDYERWRAYENRYWPRFYLVDTEGYIRCSHIGESNYSDTEVMIVELLKEV